MIKYVLIDVDDTLLDFKRSQDEAIEYALRTLGVYVDSSMIEAYDQCNRLCWERYERGEIKQQDIFLERFRLLYKQYGIYGDVEETERIYHDKLDTLSYMREGARDFLTILCSKYYVYVVTNGLKRTQTMRLKASGIDKMVRGVYISTDIGYQKPQVEFFRVIENSIPQFDKSQAVVIGDSLSSDIQGGINMGVDTIWYNAGGKKNASNLPTYTATTYDEILDILSKM